MNKINLVIAVLLLFAASCKKETIETATIEYAPLEVVESLSEAKSLAEQEKKSIFVFVSAKWCSSCATFKENVWSDAAVRAKVRERYIILLSDHDEAEGEKFRKDYNLNGRPSFLVIQSDMTEVAKRLGSIDKTAFINWIESL